MGPEGKPRECFWPHRVTLVITGNIRTPLFCVLHPTKAMDFSPVPAWLLPAPPQKLLWDAPSALSRAGTGCKCQINRWALLDGFLAAPLAAPQASCGPAWVKLIHPLLANPGRGCTDSKFFLIFFVLSSVQPLDTLKALKKNQQNPSINDPRERKVQCRHFWAKRRRRQGWK